MKKLLTLLLLGFTTLTYAHTSVSFGVNVPLVTPIYSQPSTVYYNQYPSTVTYSQPIYTQPAPVYNQYPSTVTYSQPIYTQPSTVYYNQYPSTVTYSQPVYTQPAPVYHNTSDYIAPLVTLGVGLAIVNSFHHHGYNRGYGGYGRYHR